MLDKIQSADITSRQSMITDSCSDGLDWIYVIAWDQTSTHYFQRIDAFQKAAQLLILHYWLAAEQITTHAVKVLPERNESEMNKVPMCWQP